MIVTLTCPSCGTDRSFLRPPIGECPHCGTPYPEAVRQDAEATLAREAALHAAQRPRGLTVAMFFFNGIGAVCLLSMACAAMDLGSFYINDVQVTGREFLLTGGFLLAPIGLVALGIGFSIMRDWWWSRHLILISFAIPNLGLAVAGIVFGDGSTVAAALFSAAIILGPTAAYLFFKDDVVAYYNARNPSWGKKGVSDANSPPYVSTERAWSVTASPPEQLDTEAPQGSDSVLPQVGVDAPAPLDESEAAQALAKEPRRLPTIVKLLVGVFVVYVVLRIIWFLAHEGL